ncbi:MAG: hypothetical protein IGS03_05350 [Candidatus Sericytochromatia bacterium]|nr:hypothetical protein [Candidatus Sericytochromatia bacterium]
MSSPSLPRFADEALDLSAFFDSPDLSNWEQAARDALRGDALEQLSTQSLDEVCYQPLYSAADLPAQLTQIPENADFRRGLAQPGWRIVQAYSKTDTMLQDAEEGLLEGVDGLQYEGLFDQLPDLADKPGLPSLQCLSDIVQLPAAPDAHTRFSWLWDGWSAYLQATAPDAQAFKAHHRQLRERLQAQPSDRLFISSRPWHEAGSTASLELASLAASLVDSLQTLTSESLTPEHIFRQTTLELSIGPELFLELAKCRATRIIIQRVAEAYGSDARGIQWQARTSRRFLSQLDRYNNLLRQTLSALAAVMGGVQTLITEPLDILSPAQSQTSMARRLARNLQLILRHEVHLDQWVDPAGGSYLIERLTQTLAESAWKQFQQIEAEGGLLQAWPAGHLQKQVATTAAARQQQAATRQQTLIGVNLYAAAEDGMTSPPKNLQPLQPLRLAEPFEALRQAQAADPVSVTLLPLSNTKQSQARLAFASAFFAVAGCETAIASPVANVAELAQQLAASATDILVLCGADSDYEQLLSDAQLNPPPHGQLVLAGKPGDVYRQAGVQHFIFAGCDLLASFKALKPSWLV